MTHNLDDIERCTGFQKPSCHRGCVDAQPVELEVFGSGSYFSIRLEDKIRNGSIMEPTRIHIPLSYRYLHIYRIYICNYMTYCNIIYVICVYNTTITQTQTYTYQVSSMCIEAQTIPGKSLASHHVDPCSDSWCHSMYVPLGK